MNLKYLFFAFCAMCLLSSCLDDPAPSSFTNIDKELSLHLNQKLTMEGPELAFDLKTIDGFDCEQIGIQSQLVLDNNLLTLQILSLDIPANCNEGNHHAKGSVWKSLDYGNYDFQIQMGDLISTQGNLLVGNDRLSFSASDIPGLTYQNNQILIIPNDHIYGSIEMLIFNENRWNDFFESLHQFVKQSSTIVAGDYGLFSIDFIESLTSLPNPEDLVVFQVHDLEQLRTFLMEFRLENPDFQIDLTHSTGIEL